MAAEGVSHLCRQEHVWPAPWPPLPSLPLVKALLLPAKPPAQESMGIDVPAKLAEAEATLSQLQVRRRGWERRNAACAAASSPLLSSLCPSLLLCVSHPAATAAHCSTPAALAADRRLLQPRTGLHERQPGHGVRPV